MITISIKFTGQKELVSLISKGEQEVRSGILRFGKLTLSRIHNEIKSRTKRRGSTGNLISSIRMEVEKVNNTFTLIHIGNKAVMTQEAPYWYVVNYGKKFSGGKFIPPATVGSFEGNAPSRGVNNQRWGNHRPGFFMQPKTFRPLHYIERTNSWLINYWPQFWSSILK